MTTFRDLWRNFIGGNVALSADAAEATENQASQMVPLELDIAPNDPLLAYVQQNPAVFDVAQLKLDSPALAAMRQANIRLVVPLVSQGELIGLINLGARLSEQEYSSDDFKLLGDLAAQAAPALRVAQLVKQQQEEAAARERIEQELKVAQLIQKTLLPKAVPELAGWEITAYYQPARAVGGDFYDFISLADGRMGFIVADVTDKGVPAALVMATTRSILRAAAERLDAPGAVLARTNEVLVKEIPPKMFVTCFYGILDPKSGHLHYANAGHDLPYRFTDEGVVELRATGMPLGLMPGMIYEEKETILTEGEYVLLYSDGLVEAHDPRREMFGFPRLQALLATQSDGASLNEFLLSELASFVGPGWEQEDDVTLVTLQCKERINSVEALSEPLTFLIPSAPGNEKLAMEQVAEHILAANVPFSRLERLKTAVAEATMNGMEHGNKYDPGKPTQLKVYLEADAIRVTITDEGGGSTQKTNVIPDLEAKLSGEQSPRGWGLFLIENMVDELYTHHDDKYHTIELVMKLDTQGV